MLGEAVGKSFDFDSFDVWGFDDGLAFAVFLEVLFVAAGDGGDFGDDFFAEAEEDVGVGLFEDVAVDVVDKTGYARNTLREKYIVNRANVALKLGQ